MKVEGNGDESRIFTVSRGIKQGWCILSPQLFNICAEYMIRCTMEWQGGISISERKSNNLCFADGTIWLPVVKSSSFWNILKLLVIHMACRSTSVKQKWWWSIVKYTWMVWPFKESCNCNWFCVLVFTTQ